MSRNLLTEAQIRRIVQEEVTLQMLEEGMWDDVKAGATRLKALVSKQFGKAAARWGSMISEKIHQLSEIPEDAKAAMSALKAAMKETGESIRLDDNLKAAKDFSSLTKEKALAIAQSDFEGPVHNLAKEVQSSGTKAEAKHYAGIYSILIEANQPSEVLTEFGVSGVLGVGLAVLGGLPMLFTGLHKLAKALKAEKLAHLFEKAEHVTHAFEVKTINAIVPNKLSYAAYKQLHKWGLRFSDETHELLTFDEYVSDEDGSHAMKRVNGLLYKAILIYFAFNGLAGVLHAGASLVGVVEGAATTVKGVELARGAMEIAALTSKTV